MAKSRAKQRKQKVYGYGYLEFELKNGRKIRRKIKLPVPRYNYGIYKVKGDYVVLSGWSRPNPKEYRYNSDYLLTDYHKIPEGTRVVRLIIGKRVVGKRKL